MTRFVGIDLAWGTRARSGLAVTDDAGRLTASTGVRTDDEIVSWLRAEAPDAAVLAVDAPLVVPNETGQRRCETEISRAFWRYKIGAHSANRRLRVFDPPRGAVLAQRCGWSVDPALRGTTARPVALEVYPHPAMVVLFGLEERIVYKAGRARGPARVAGFRQLVAHLATIDQLRLPEHPRWAELRAVADDPGRGDLSRIEDELDAILCAHLAWRWHHRRDSLAVYGSLEEGYIVAPPPPEG